VRFEFVNWDDQLLLVHNPFFRGFDWAHLRWMLTTTLSGNFMPLSWLSYGLDHALWGLNPAGYHLTNVLLHAANAAVYCALAKRLLRSSFSPVVDGPEIPIAAVLSALLSPSIPLAESVAWVTERRVLSEFIPTDASAVCVRP
jgi:hypothetical protein